MKINLTRNFLIFSWAAMLLAGNVGVNLSYWGALPAGLLVAWVAGGKAVETDNS